jgi:hypothetical protein
MVTTYILRPGTSDIPIPSNLRLIFGSRNGVGAGVNKGKTPYSGKVYSSTLEQVVANFAVDPSTGKLTQTDWFEPFNFDTQLDGGDRDMASAGVALLDRTVFNAPGVGVNGIAVASGKDGIVRQLSFAGLCDEC